MGETSQNVGFCSKEYELLSLPMTIGEDEETSVEEDDGEDNCTMQCQGEDPKLVGGLEEADGAAGENCKGDERERWAEGSNIAASAEDELWGAGR
jgi:hypothetical protein